jgi:hypothetical protein
LARARKGQQGTWLGVRWLGVRLDWFGVRVALGAVATAVLLLGLRGSHSPGLLARGVPPWPAPAPSAVAAGVRAAGLPLLAAPGQVVRFAVHLDVIVDGKPVTIPAGIGQVEPVDRGPGPCPDPPESLTIGDCAPGHYVTADIAASQLQTHTSSGILHLQAERPGELRLGQFFEEWGVRFDRNCLGAYCAGAGKQLRVYVNGKRRRGDPRRLALRDGQEIAVVFGGPGAFRSVPVRYGKRIPAGCGGPGEHTCFPG